MNKIFCNFHKVLAIHMLLLNREVKKFAQGHTSKLVSGRARFWSSVSLILMFILFPQSSQLWVLYIIKAQARSVETIGRQKRETSYCLHKGEGVVDVYDKPKNTKNIFLPKFLTFTSSIINLKETRRGLFSSHAFRFILNINWPLRPVLSVIGPFLNYLKFHQN